MTESRHLGVRRDVGPVQIAVEDRARRHVLARPLRQRQHRGLMGGERLRPLLLRRRLGGGRGRGLQRLLGGLERLDLGLDVLAEAVEGLGWRRRSGRRRGRRLRRRGIAREQAADGGVARAALESQQQRLGRRLRRPHGGGVVPFARLFRPVLPHPRPILSDSRGLGKGRSGRRQCTPREASSSRPSPCARLPASGRLRRGDDRALHQDVPLARERRRVGDAGRRARSARKRGSRQVCGLARWTGSRGRPSPASR